jgi:hypothetical protein
VPQVVILGGRGESVSLDLPEAIANPYGCYGVPTVITLPGFSASAAPVVELADLQSFQRQLLALYDSLAGVAVLDPGEGQLSLEISAEKLGAMKVKGRLADRGYGLGGTGLTFEFATDQTYLQAPLSVLTAYCEKTPLEAPNISLQRP